MSSLSSLPSGLAIAFDDASVAKGPFQHSLFLWVKGPCPGEGRAVRLAPRIHNSTPDYWDIDVLSVRASEGHGGACWREEDGFACSLPLTGITGTRGVRVIGANGAREINIG